MGTVLPLSNRSNRYSAFAQPVSSKNRSRQAAWTEGERSSPPESGGVARSAGVVQKPPAFMDALSGTTRLLLMLDPASRSRCPPDSGGHFLCSAIISPIIRGVSSVWLVPCFPFQFAMIAHKIANVVWAQTNFRSPLLQKPRQMGRSSLQILRRSPALMRRRAWTSGAFETRDST